MGRKKLNIQKNDGHILCFELRNWKKDTIRRVCSYIWAPNGKPFVRNTGCYKSLGHILTLNTSVAINGMKTHLANSENL